jgi:cytochrome c-type biogenesis protein CcmF
MIPEVGQFALILALLLALVQGLLPIAGTVGATPALRAVARPAAQAQALFVGIALAALAWSFAVNDFSVAYVAGHSNTNLPMQYRLAAVWGGHEGSMLLWAAILSGWTLAVTIRSRRLPEDMAARIVGVMGLVSTGVLAFLLFTSNPFERLLPAALEGRDLNPLLQDPGMVFHPPMLYMGYVGFSVAFAFAIAALLGGRLDAAWARWSRPWTIVAWLFLTLGIALGSWWAYYELGWGGWWFWDPVENASFMPWLAGTALIHSLAVTERRGAFRGTTVLLAIGAFSLSLLGTFLVRSGVLTSVHAFATDPRRGVFILALLVVVVGGSLALFAARVPRVSGGGRFAFVSRESMLAANNMFLVVAVAAVLLGTLYPLVLDALGLGKISVGPPYFETVFVPLLAPALFLMAVGPLARWRESPLPHLARRLAWAAGVAVVTGAVTPVLLGRWSPLAAAGLLLAAWIAAAGVENLRGRLAAMRRAGPGAGRLPAAYWGMLVAHLGVAVFVAGVTVVKGYEAEKDVRMAAGDTVELAGYTFRFEGMREVNGPNYTAARGEFTVFRGGHAVSRLYPEKRVYQVQRKPMTEAAIDAGLWRDLYVSLGEPVAGNAWTVRVHYKPLIDWVWGGCVLMALGGLLAALDRRYRVAPAGSGAAPRSEAERGMQVRALPGGAE